MYNLDITFKNRVHSKSRNILGFYTIIHWYILERIPSSHTVRLLVPHHFLKLLLFTVSQSMLTWLISSIWFSSIKNFLVQEYICHNVNIVHENVFWDFWIWTGQRKVKLNGKIPCLALSLSLKSTLHFINTAYSKEKYTQVCLWSFCLFVDWYKNLEQIIGLFTVSSPIYSTTNLLIRPPITAGFVDRIRSPGRHLYYSGSIKERRTGLFDLNPY